LYPSPAASRATVSATVAAGTSAFELTIESAGCGSSTPATHASDCTARAVGGRCCACPATRCATAMAVSVSPRSATSCSCARAPPSIALAKYAALSPDGVKSELALAR
jgi:hypothetical protein